MPPIRLETPPTEKTFIDELPVSPRARRWLVAGGVQTVAQLLMRTEHDLLTLDNFSHTTLANVKRYLARHNLKLKPARPHLVTGAMIHKALDDHASRLDARERQILRLRHGVTDDKAQTLVEIGLKLDLTRERVRQIQKLAEQKVIAYHAHGGNGEARK